MCRATGATCSGAADAAERESHRRRRRSIDGLQTTVCHTLIATCHRLRLPLPFALSDESVDLLGALTALAAAAAAALTVNPRTEQWAPRQEMTFQTPRSSSHLALLSLRFALPLDYTY